MKYSKCCNPIAVIISLLLTPALLPAQSTKKADTRPPTVRIIEPKTHIATTQPFRVIAEAQDNRAVAKVIFYVDGKPVHEALTPPYQFTFWVGFWADGKTHQLNAVAFDEAANRGVSNPVNITVAPSAAAIPRLIYPVNNLVIQDLARIPLHWKPERGAEFYIVAVSRTEDFSEIIFNLTTPDTTTVTTALTEGTYYWAVIAQNNVGNMSSWSYLRSFSLKAPAPPRLSVPRSGFYFKGSEIPGFSWYSSPYATQYEARIALMNNPKVTVATQTCRDTTTTIEGLTEGWYIWLVRACNVGGIWGDWSENRKFFKTDPEITEFVKVPAGPFTFGPDKQIQTINYDFEIMKYPVTCQQFLHFLNQAYARNDINKKGMGYYVGDSFFPSGVYAYFDIDNDKSEIGDIHFDLESNAFVIENNDYLDHPIADVSWFGAHAFARWYGLHLPTEQEWEKSARGNTGNDFPWGTEIVCENANIAGCRRHGYRNATTPVGQFNGQDNTIDSPSPYGAYDMCGNVWEWTASLYGGKFASDRVVRGGSFYETKATPSGRDELTTWFRYHKSPKEYEGKLGSGIGFRCVRK